MFAGMPGTGIGALFFALICVILSLFNRVYCCGSATLLSSVWIVGCLLLLYGAGLGGGTGHLSLFYLPVFLLVVVLSSAALAARILRPRAQQRSIQQRQ